MYSPSLVHCAAMASALPLLYASTNSLAFSRIACSAGLISAANDMQFKMATKISTVVEVRIDTFIETFRLRIVDVLMRNQGALAESRAQLMKEARIKMPTCG